MKPLDEASRDVIKAGRAGEAPTSADRERLRRRLGAALAAGVAGPAIAAPVATAAKWWASKAVLASLGTVGVVAIAGAVVLSRPARHDVPVTPPPVAPVVAVVAPPVVEPTLEDDEPDEVAVVEGVDDVPRAPTKRPTRNPKPPKVVAASEPKDEPRDEPLPPLPVAPVVTPEPDTLEAETGGLRDVYAALKAKDSARALKLLTEQDAKFPRGQLRPEREAARVLALCASSPAEGATALARFIDAHPGSPLVTRLKGACTP